MHRFWNQSIRPRKIDQQPRCKSFRKAKFALRPCLYIFFHASSSAPKGNLCVVRVQFLKHDTVLGVATPRTGGTHSSLLQVERARWLSMVSSLCQSGRIELDIVNSSSSSPRGVIVSTLEIVISLWTRKRNMIGQ